MPRAATPTGYLPMSPEPDLEVRWLVHTPTGPRLVSVRTRAGRYTALDVSPVPAGVQPVHVTAESAADALAKIVDKLGGTAAFPLPLRAPHRFSSGGG